ARGSLCKKEWSRALSYKKPVLPLLSARGVEVPLLLQDRQYIDLTQDFDAAVGRLRAHLDWLASPEGVLQTLRDRLADPPPAPAPRAARARARRGGGRPAGGPGRPAAAPAGRPPGGRPQRRGEHRPGAVAWPAGRPGGGPGRPGQDRQPAAGRRPGLLPGPRR